MLPGSTGTWHQHLGAFQTAWHFITCGQPIGKTGRKNRERKSTQGDGIVYVNKSILAPYVSIPNDAIRHWKGILHALNHAFSKESMDLLIFLSKKNVTSQKLRVRLKLW
jgi:hypothetical protein